MGKKRGGAISRITNLLTRWRGKSSSTPSDVPPGHVAVIVGLERRRFILRASHLSHPSFQKLLAEAEEEYGYGYCGPISIPCEEEVFLETLRRVRSGSGSTRFGRTGQCDSESTQLLLVAA